MATRARKLNQGARSIDVAPCLYRELRLIERCLNAVDRQLPALRGLKNLDDQLKDFRRGVEAFIELNRGLKMKAVDAATIARRLKKDPANTRRKLCELELAICQDGPTLLYDEDVSMKVADNQNGK